MKRTLAVILALLAMCAPAFSGCGGGKVNYILSEEGGKHYIVSCSGLPNLTGEYEIPAYYGEGDSYAPVTAIADEGFASTRFSKIIVPETITEIGVAAFGFCLILETVEFAQGIQLEKFSRGLFGNSTNLKEIDVPDSVTALDELTFKGCTNLSSVTMTGVQTIGYGAFYGCTALESVTLPSTLTSIGELAFYSSGLKEIEIPASVCDTQEGYGLGYASFASCLSLERVKIANGIKTIPSASFGYCISLKEIYIPLSVEEVQGVYSENGIFRYGHAFYGASALTDVYYEGTQEQWKDIKIETKNAYQNNMTMDNTALINADKHYNS